MKQFHHFSRGFTLVELLIVVGIIGLLATIAVFALQSAQTRGRDSKRISDIKAMQKAMELYYNENAVYPSLASSGTNTWPELSAVMDNFMSALPADPDQADDVAYTYLVYTTAGSTQYKRFYLGADLEDVGRQALQQDIDGTVGGTGWRSITSVKGSATSGTFTGLNATFDCEDTNGIYCLSGDATTN